MTRAPEFLYPTPARRRLLEHVADGRVFRDAATHDYLSGERRVCAVVRELEQAGWVELGAVVERDEAGDMALWAPTPYGRAVAEVRIHDFGIDAFGSSIVAEVGDLDEPRVLGHVVRLYRPARWQVTVGGYVEEFRTRPEAWGELWHRACFAHAADLAVPDPYDCRCNPEYEHEVGCVVRAPASKD